MASSGSSFVRPTTKSSGNATVDPDRGDDPRAQDDDEARDLRPHISAERVAQHRLDEIGADDSEHARRSPDQGECDPRRRHDVVGRALRVDTRASSGADVTSPRENAVTVTRLAAARYA